MQVQTEAIHNAVHAQGGLLEQAKAAQASGALPAFFAKLLQTLGPILGPLIQALLASLLNPTPAVTK